MVSGNKGGSLNNYLCLHSFTPGRFDSFKPKETESPTDCSDFDTHFLTQTIKRTHITEVLAAL